MRTRAWVSRGPRAVAQAVARPASRPPPCRQATRLNVLDVGLHAPIAVSIVVSQPATPFTAREYGADRILFFLMSWGNVHGVSRKLCSVCHGIFGNGRRRGPLLRVLCSTATRLSYYGCSSRAIGAGIRDGIAQPSMGDMICSVAGLSGCLWSLSLRQGENGCRHILATCDYTYRTVYTSRTKLSSRKVSNQGFHQ